MRKRTQCMVHINPQWRTTKHTWTTKKQPKPCSTEARGRNHSRSAPYVIVNVYIHKEISTDNKRGMNWQYLAFRIFNFNTIRWLSHETLTKTCSSAPTSTTRTPHNTRGNTKSSGQQSISLQYTHEIQSNWHNERFKTHSLCHRRQTSENHL